MSVKCQFNQYKYKVVIRKHVNIINSIRKPHLLKSHFYPSHEHEF